MPFLVGKRKRSLWKMCSTNIGTLNGVQGFSRRLISAVVYYLSIIIQLLICTLYSTNFCLTDLWNRILWYHFSRKRGLNSSFSYRVYIGIRSSVAEIDITDKCVRESNKAQIWDSLKRNTLRSECCTRVAKASGFEMMQVYR